MNSSSDFGYGKLLAKLQKQEESGELYRELVEPSREVYFSGPLNPPFAKEEFARRQPELRAWAEFWRRGLPTGSRSQAPLIAAFLAASRELQPMPSKLIAA